MTGYALRIQAAPGRPVRVEGGYKTLEEAIERREALRTQMGGLARVGVFPSRRVALLAVPR